MCGYYWHFFFHFHSYFYSTLKQNKIVIPILHSYIHPNTRIEIIKFIPLKKETGIGKKKIIFIPHLRVPNMPIKFWNTEK